MSALSVDPLWPRAGDWAASAREETPDAVLLGVPAWRTSLSPTGAGETPAAVRDALRRYSPTIMGPPPLDLNVVLRIVDAGDVGEPDGREGEARVRAAVAELASARLLIALGGDNSATYAVAQGRRSGGLITLDAHFDLREGESNGSPVRRLLAEGLDPRRVVQIGIADFANSTAYARRALDAGITVITVDEVRRRGIAEVVQDALGIAGGGSLLDAGDRDTGRSIAVGGEAAADDAPAAGRPAAPGGIHLDIDVDVCDRSAAPGCPASVPGGLAAWELRALVRGITRDPRVTSADIVEVDATADTDDGRTVRLAALCVLELLAGLAERP
jgi:formiminoglutamase